MTAPLPVSASGPGLRALLLAALALTLSCTSPSADGNPTAPTPQAPTIAISSSGVSPKAVQISVGGRVRFVNNDTATHTIGSDPHPEHTDCPEINQVGFLLPGQSRETGNLVLPRTCGFHDHERPDVQALRGTITIR